MRIHNERYFDITGKVAVVTGGAGLLGSQFSKVLADYGATVILTDYDINQCQKRAKNLEVKRLFHIN